MALDLAVPAPQQYYGMRRKPKLGPIFQEIGSNYLPSIAFERQAEKQRAQEAVDLDQFNQQVALEKQNLADFRELSALRESSLDRRAKEKADLDKLLLDKTTASTNQITRNTLAAQTRMAEKQRTLGYVSAGLGAAGLAVGAAGGIKPVADAIWEGMNWVGGLIGRWGA